MNTKARCSPDRKRIPKFRRRRKNIFVDGSFDADGNSRWLAAARLVLETVNAAAFIAINPLSHGVS